MKFIAVLTALVLLSGPAFAMSDDQSGTFANNTPKFSAPDNHPFGSVNLGLPPDSNNSSAGNYSTFGFASADGSIGSTNGFLMPNCPVGAICAEKPQH